ncbi:MAG: hypothetical protein ABIS47_03190 [Acidimicrobiales bacterium]
MIRGVVLDGPAAVTLVVMLAGGDGAALVVVTPGNGGLTMTSVFGGAGSVTAVTVVLGIGGFVMTLASFEPHPPMAATRTTGAAKARRGRRVLWRRLSCGASEGGSERVMALGRPTPPVGSR